MAETEVRLGETEVVRQLLARCLLHDAWAGESDEGSWLGDQHIPEAREARKQPARRRVREDRDESNAGVVQVLDRGNGLRELHQREDSLLHACAAGGGHGDERRAALDRAVARTRELLADDA